MYELSTLIAFLSLAPAFAQDASLYVVPRWKVGDTRNLVITEAIISSRDSTGVGEHRERHATARVVNETPEAYILRIQCDNPTMAAGGATEPVMLRYSVSKRNGRARLENWKETATAVQKSVDAGLKSLGDTAAAHAATRRLAPTMRLLKDSLGTETCFSEVIGYLTFPFGKDLTEKDTLHTAVRGTVDFGGLVRDSVPIAVRTNAQRIDRLEQQAVVRSERRVDPAALSTTIKTSPTTKSVERRKPGGKPTTSAVNAPMGQVDEQLYTMDLRTGWLLSFTSTERSMGLPSGGNSTCITRVTLTP